MESRIILLLAICYPFLTASQSRGESGQVRLPITTAVQGYLRERQQKLPYLTQPYSPNEQIFFQQQTQVQSYPQHVQPEYYPSQPSYSQPNNQPSHQSYPQSGFVAPLTPFPVPSPDKQVYQRPQPQSNNLVNRFGGEQAQSYQPTSAEEFTSRPTRPPGAVRTTKKPQVFTPPRFDDRGDSNVRKTLVFDPVLSNSMEGFSLELLFNFVVSEPNTNFMVSPFSVYHMLVLIAEGAKDKTYDEISSKLRLGDIQKTRDFQQYLNTVLSKNTADVQLQKFAMLVTDRARPVKREYEDLVEKTYDAFVEPVDFLDVDKTLRLVNGLVSNLTRGQITDTIMKDDLFKAQLILITGLFFQGKWMNVFNTTFTKREQFFDSNGVALGNVNMMFQRGPFAYSAVADLGCHVVELPYAEVPASRNNGAETSSLSMIVVLPRKGLSLEEASTNVHTRGMEFIYRELYNSKQEYEDEEVEVHLPRFEMTTSLNVKETLKSMGIQEVFDEGLANLSNINQRYFISSMIHKTKISVDERGTTAAAVTTSIFANKATPPKFHANKPFLFFIVDKRTKLILFCGQYANPELY